MDALVLCIFEHDSCAVTYQDFHQTEIQQQRITALNGITRNGSNVNFNPLAVLIDIRDLIRELTVDTRRSLSKHLQVNYC